MDHTSDEDNNTTPSISPLPTTNESYAPTVSHTNKTSPVEVLDEISVHSKLIKQADKIEKYLDPVELKKEQPSLPSFLWLYNVNKLLSGTKKDISTDTQVILYESSILWSMSYLYVPEWI